MAPAVRRPSESPYLADDSTVELDPCCMTNFVTDFSSLFFWLNQSRVCNFLYILLQLNIGSTVGQHLSFVASSYVHNR